MTDHRSIMEDFIAGLNKKDFSIVDRHYTDDIVDEYPQSGEVIRGKANIKAILEHYPGGNDTAIAQSATLRNQPVDAVKVIAPTFSIVQVDGGGDSGTTALRGVYPDNSVWWIVVMYKLRGDRVCRSTTFFGPEFPAPDWRSAWVERSR